MELLPYHKHQCKTENKHYQQIILKITPEDNEQKPHIKFTVDCIRGLL